MTQKRLLLHTSLIVSAITLGGSLVSFVNQLVLARLFGAGREMDLYLIAISLPAIVTSLIVGALGYQLVPALQHARAQGASDVPLLRSFALGLGGGSAVIAVICHWKSEFLVTLMNPNLSVAQLETASQIAMTGWWCLPFATLYVIYTAALHIRLRFFVAAIFGPFPAIGTLVVCSLTHTRFGTASIAWGQLGGYAVAALGCRVALGVVNSSMFDWEGVRNLLGKLPLAVAALLLFVIYPFSDAFWGARIGPSAVSYLGYAQRILVGFSGLAVVGATTVLFPHFAKYAAEGDHLSLHKSLAASMRAMFSVMAPLSAIFAVLSPAIIQFLFAKGAFTSEDTANLARLISLMLVGMVAMSLMGLAFKALFALRKTREAAGISVIGAIVYWALSSVSVAKGRVEVIGVAYSITWWVILSGTCIVLGMRIRQLILFALGIGTISAVCAGTALAGERMVHYLCGSDHQTGQMLSLPLSGIGALAVYAVAALVWPGIPELRAVAGGALHKGFILKS